MCGSWLYIVPEAVFMLFSTWLEGREVKDAILGVVGGEKELENSTKNFSADIRRRLKGLGVVKATNDNMGRYGRISDSIDKGIKVSDLIKSVEG
jgi:hypothetical protein